MTPAIAQIEGVVMPQGVVGHVPATAFLGTVAPMHLPEVGSLVFTLRFLGRCFLCHEGRGVAGGERTVRSHNKQ